MKSAWQSLIGFIEEQLRITSRNRISYIDPHGFLDRLKREQNHVVFGRRGAGKSLLTTNLAQEREAICVYVNLEDYKDITFPNIVIKVLGRVFENLRKASATCRPVWKGNIRAMLFRRKLHKEETSLSTMLSEPDTYRKTEISRRRLDKSAGISATSGGLSATLEGGGGTETEEKRTVSQNKQQALRTNLTAYKQLVEEACLHIRPDQPVFLVLDDLYFVPKKIQSDFIDYFHRMTKDTPLFLKIATIRHRSKLYRQDSGTYIGMEIGADVLDIDLDYTLDKFEELRQFMRRLLQRAIDDSSCGLDIDSIFAGDGFSQLCLASGGVPRDFLTLFVKLGNGLIADAHRTSIGKIDVNEIAIANINNKINSLKTDSENERELLEAYLESIRKYVYTEKRTNVFLVAKEDLARFPQERQAIKELIDLRLLHLLNNNTSCAPSDGRRYEAYMLDVGLYENSRPRNFLQIEPGEVDQKSRKDALRASPKCSLEKLAAEVRDKGIQGQLVLSEE